MKTTWHLLWDCLVAKANHKKKKLMVDFRCYVTIVVWQLYEGLLNSISQDIKPFLLDQSEHILGQLHHLNATNSIQVELAN